VAHRHAQRAAALHRRRCRLVAARRAHQRACYGAWTALDVTGWQMHAGSDSITPLPALLVHSGGQTHEVRVGALAPDGEVTVQVGAESLRLALAPMADGHWRLRRGDCHETLQIARKGEALFVQGGEGAFTLGTASYVNQVAAARKSSGQLRTPMMGVILQTHVAVGDLVRAGDLVATMESMKMELRITAEHDGVVRSLSVQPARWSSAASSCRDRGRGKRRTRGRRNSRGCRRMSRLSRTARPRQ
jgi:Biotin carboxyl carrier protein